MGSKLKMKSKTPRTRLPISNQQMQQFKTSAFATKETLELAEARMKQQIYADVEKQIHDEIIPKLRDEIEETAWNESEEWTNVINTATFLHALKLEGFGQKRMLRVIRNANKHIEKINSGEESILGLIDVLETEDKVMFDDDYKELVRKYQCAVTS